MAKYNDALARGMFDKQAKWASASEERKRLEEAGLNVGLMYGGSGAGGSTPSQSAGSGSGASGGVAGATQMGMAMQMAQIENIKAQTKKTEAETESVGLDINQKTMSNWMQDFMMNFSGKKIHTSDGKEYDAADYMKEFKAGNVNVSPEIARQFNEIIEGEARKDKLLSDKLEKDLQNEARILGVSDIDPMYIRMGARYAIEQGIDKDDARFSLTAAKAAVSLFEMFTAAGIAKNVGKAIKGGKQGGKAE
jgi:hypothetical protein